MNFAAPFQQPYGGPPIVDVLDPQFLQFLDYIDRNWSWRTIIGVSNFIGDFVNPKNCFGDGSPVSLPCELLSTCIQQNILIVQTDITGAEDLRLNRMHPDVDEILSNLCASVCPVAADAIMMFDFLVWPFSVRLWPH